MKQLFDREEIQETNKLFVVGTDTGVGKTLVSRTFARLLVNQGMNVRVVKPLESGCETKDGKLYAEDAEALREAAKLSDNVEVCRYKGERPVTPAEALGDKAPTLDEIQLLLEHVEAEESDFVLAEGAGGLMVPYGKDGLLIELLAALQWPVLLVGRSSLGTINHVLLSLLALEKYQIPVFGVVLNRHQEALAPDEAKNPYWITQYEDVRPFIFPYIKPEQQQDTEVLAALVESRAPSFCDAVYSLIPDEEDDEDVEETEETKDQTVAENKNAEEVTEEKKEDATSEESASAEPTPEDESDDSKEGADLQKKGPETKKE